MLSRLANYLLGGVAGEEEEEAVGVVVVSEVMSQPHQQMHHRQRQPRLRQVTVECDEWVLVEPHSMDESWYVTPPACFTQPGPVHVETSPLEDLLIEHPSMSVYHSASGPSDDLFGKQQQQQQQPQQQQRTGPTAEAARKTSVHHHHHHHHHHHQQQQQQQHHHPRQPLGRRNDNTVALVGTAATLSDDPASKRTGNNEGRSSRDKRHQQQQQQESTALVSRRTSVRELRSAHRDENLRIVQIRSAQKIMEKRSSSASKRNILERNNKVREVSAGKGKRPRRQDRLRFNNSNVNNNRKC